MGAELSSLAFRKEHSVETRYRVVPNTIREYELFREKFYSFEIDEICVANETMSFQDYLDCRLFNLTIEIFYNNGVFAELFKFLESFEIPIATVILGIHKRITSSSSQISEIYGDFLRETKELWEDGESLIASLENQDTIEEYLSGEKGNNEQLMYRAISFFYNMKELHEIAFDVSEKMLAKNRHFDRQRRAYFDELFRFSLARKENVLSLDSNLEAEFEFDFKRLLDSSFGLEPLSCHRPDGVMLRFSHSDIQRQIISKCRSIYGTSNRGLGSILSNSTLVIDLFRSVQLI